MARWSALTDYLATAEDSCHLTWDQLGTLVGDLPASASRYRAWWSGDRPHVRAWRAAGFRLAKVSLGREVTFVREVPASPRPLPSLSPSVDWQLEVGRSTAGTTQDRPSPDNVLLIACSKGKLDHPAAAKDLYSSPLFRSARAYAEGTGYPWFILSAEHGLVAPDEWLAPYDRYLPDTPPSFREAWGRWVVERLDLLVGGLANRTVEVHAGSAYVQAIIDRLGAKGCRVNLPLEGLAVGERQHWYTVRREPVAATRHPGAPSADGSSSRPDEPAAFAALLLDEQSRRPPASLPPGRPDRPQGARPLQLVGRRTGGGRPLGRARP